MRGSKIFYTPAGVLTEDGTDTGFRNVGQLQFDAGEIPKRTYTIFKSQRKFEIKNTTNVDLDLLVLKIKFLPKCVNIFQKTGASSHTSVAGL